MLCELPLQFARILGYHAHVYYSALQNLGLGGIARCAAAVCVVQVLGKHLHGFKSIIQFYRSFRSIRKVSAVLSSIPYSQLGCHVQVCFMEQDWATCRPSKLVVYVEAAINEVSTKLQIVWAIFQCSTRPSFVVLYAKRGKSPLFPFLLTLPRRPRHHPASAA